MEIKGAVAIVTGGDSGLGQHICRKLAAQGANVVIVYHSSPDNAEALARELSALGAESVAFQADVSIAQEVEGLVKRVLDRFGRLDILVNNAGYNPPVPPMDINALTPELWNRTLLTNVTGPYLLMRAAAPALKASGAGRIVNIASSAGLAPTGSNAAYGVSKAALIQLTRNMAVLLAPEVTVNAVAPGFMEGTGMTGHLKPEQLEQARMSAALKRSVDKDDVAEQILTLIRSDSITGQTVVIDAGRIYH